jgi:NAD+ kinase
LIEVINGSYIEDERFFLESSINTKKTKFISLNEVVIHSGKLAQMFEYELCLDDRFVYRQKADGIIISTPTGSTAYSLSGNGPIIHPDVKAINLMPMFPHSLNARPLLVDENVKIEIKVISKNNNKTKLSMDSHNSISLKNGDSVTINKSNPKLKLIHPKGHDFYQASRNKLGWSLNISK